MGAEDISHKFDGKLSFSQLQSAVSDLISEAKHESGHGGYTGTWAECPGVNDTRRVFKTTNEAFNYLQAKVQKWENALAARVEGTTTWVDATAERNFVKVQDEILKSSAKYQAKLKKVNDLESIIAAEIAGINAFKNEMWDKIRASKRRVECDCGCAIAPSKIATSRGCFNPVDEASRQDCDFTNTKTPECPVCGASLLTDTAKKRIVALNAKVNAAGAKYRAELAECTELSEKLVEKEKLKASKSVSYWIVYACVSR